MNSQIVRYWPVASFLILAAVVYMTTGSSMQYAILFVVFIVLPMLDPDWKKPVMQFNGIAWLGLLAVTISLVIYKPELEPLFYSTLLFAALPEEWFFRAYFMRRVGKGIKANIITSLCFSALHLITQGPVNACLVFAPSLVFGWLYQKQNDLTTIVLLHAVSNVVYIGFLQQHFAWLYRS